MSLFHKTFSCTWLIFQYLPASKSLNAFKRNKEDVLYKLSVQNIQLATQIL